MMPYLFNCRQQVVQQSSKSCVFIMRHDTRQQTTRVNACRCTTHMGSHRGGVQRGWRGASRKGACNAAPDRYVYVCGVIYVYSHRVNGRGGRGEARETQPGVMRRKGIRLRKGHAGWCERGGRGRSEGGSGLMGGGRDARTSNHRLRGEHATDKWMPVRPRTGHETRHTKPSGGTYTFC